MVEGAEKGEGELDGEGDEGSGRKRGEREMVTLEVSSASSPVTTRDPGVTFMGRTSGGRMSETYILCIHIHVL